MKFELRKVKPASMGLTSVNYDLLAVTECEERRIATIYKHFWPRRWERSWLVVMKGFYYESECQSLKLARQDAETQFKRRRPYVVCAEAA